jgi:RAB6A-GEF complex partner protein 2
LDGKQRHLRRVHAEHHSSFTLSTQRTTFALDIPSDASPAFQIKLSPDHGSPSPSPIIGGLEWKVRLKLSVAIAAETSDAGTEGVRFKSLVRDGPRGEWASSWRACSGVAPKQKLAVTASHKSQKSWAAALADSLLGTVENKYHDGDEEDLDLDEEEAYDGIRPNRDGGVGTGVNFGGGETGWADIRMETVECEVPIKVWPGNTIFKAIDVVFDV